jgi:uncharacterized protein
MRFSRTLTSLFAVPLLVACTSNSPPEAEDVATILRERFTKTEHRIEMRDGTHLFTAVYHPRDTSEAWPILLIRTPYGVHPYGEGEFPDNRWGPSPIFLRENYIFVKQDVRGRFQSEGEFVNMRPHLDEKGGPNDIDESTDTFDTIEWLVNHVPGNNGRVGLYGISYCGFYAAAGMIDAHPALKAVTPEAPIADWYFDDFHHHGAFCLADCFGFFYSFGRVREELTEVWPPRFSFPTEDGYQFFLELGPLKNVNERHYHGEIPFWNDAVAHPDYDEYWQARNILPHLDNVAPAVMTVGGWYDAEDLYGSLNTYYSIEANDPGTSNVLVMGPWQHGGWARVKGDRLGDIEFGAETSIWFREKIGLPFFDHHLKGREMPPLPEATVFETGRNRWREFDDWPPRETEEKRLWLRAGGGLAFGEAPTTEGTGDEYVSDPTNPVPLTDRIATRTPREYMVDDQRFATGRPDVLVYRSEVLEADVTLAGPILADLWVSTSGTDSDWVVKLIDVLPPDTPDPPGLREGVSMSGFQRMVRSEVIRGRYRNGYDSPEPFAPDEPTRVRLPLQDVLHTFQKGHRIMVHIQSSWFPMIDRNPQTYVDNIFLAGEEDFEAATQRIHCSKAHPSSLVVGVLPTFD